MSAPKEKFWLSHYVDGVPEQGPHISLNVRPDGMPAGPLIPLSDPRVPQDIRKRAQRYYDEQKAIGIESRRQAMDAFYRDHPEMKGHPAMSRPLRLGKLQAV